MKKLYALNAPATRIISSIELEDGFLVDANNIPQSCICLSEKLLNFHDDRVVLYYHEEYANDLFALNGTIYNGKIKLKSMAQNKCHDNASLLWAAHPDKYQIMTGFSLDYDTWRRHSWVIDKNGVLVETTRQREMYFGVEVMNEDYVLHNSIKPKT